MINKIAKILIIFIFIISISTIFIFDLTQYSSFEFVKRKHTELQIIIKSNFYFYLFIFFIIYVIITTFALPVAAVKTILAGALFGLIPGVIITSFASSIGSTFCFLMSRFVFRNYIEQKYSKYIFKVNEGISKNGSYYLFFLRLSPIFPFFIINLIFGVTKMKTTTFYFISQVGMLIGTIVFVNAGAQLAKINNLNDILSLKIIISFMLIGLMPLVLKKIIERYNNDQNINKFIKTECGLSKYYLLKAKKGAFNKIRFYWFVMIATIRDLPKFRQN